MLRQLERSCWRKDAVTGTVGRVKEQACKRLHVLYRQGIVAKVIKFPVGKKLKNFRIDDTIAERFEAWCHELGAVQERVIEALMLQAIATTPDAYVTMMRALSDWKTSRGVFPVGGQGDKLPPIAERVADSLKRRKKTPG